MRCQGLHMCAGSVEPMSLAPGNIRHVDRGDFWPTANTNTRSLGRAQLPLRASARGASRRDLFRAGRKVAQESRNRLITQKKKVELTLLKTSAKTHHDTTINKNKNANQSAFLKTKPINTTAVQLTSRGIESCRPTPRLILFVLTPFIFKAPNYMLARTLTERVV